MARTMATHKFSRAAYDRLKAEFDDLTTRGRIDVAEKIELAREEGDLKENAEIIDDQFVYTIVYEGDSDDMAERYVVGNIEEQIDGADVISSSSPLGSALQGARVGQHVDYEAPNGAQTVKVLNVESV